MKVLYEDSMLNYIIVTVASPLRDLADDKVVAFTNLDLLSPADLCDDDEIIILLSTTYPVAYIEATLPEPMHQVKIAVRGLSEDNEIQTENFAMVNWHTYWSQVSRDANLLGLSRQIFDELYMTKKTPSLTQRRLLTHVGNLTRLPRFEFFAELKSLDYGRAINAGRKALDALDRTIQFDIANSDSCRIDGLTYVFAMSNNIDTAYQIFTDGRGADIVILAQKSLRFKSYKIQMVIGRAELANRHCFQNDVIASSDLVYTFHLSAKRFDALLEHQRTLSPVPDPPVEAEVEEQPVVVIEEEQPVVVIEEEQPVVVIEEEQPVVVIEEEQPVVIEEEHPVVVIEEEQPVVVIEEQKPTVARQSPPPKKVQERKKPRPEK